MTDILVDVASVLTFGEKSGKVVVRIGYNSSLEFRALIFLMGCRRGEKPNVLSEDNLLEEEVCVEA